jgi:hypothetical protein
MNAAPLQPVLSRRAFIFGISALAGGLVLGTPAAFAQAAAQAPTPTLSAIDIRSVCECAGDAHCVIVAASAVTIRSIFMSRSLRIQGSLTARGTKTINQGVHRGRRR